LKDLKIHLYVGKFGEEGAKKGLRLLVDAEYTYMNPGTFFTGLFRSERLLRAVSRSRIISVEP
jgi:hypothetical protein